ncbi:C-type lysozyme inhibitor [Cronobacter sakazakii]|uniref:C-type lysozyme inhibitor n=2 Tax=Cronobacter sakazakii TaxID=28141 RepID=A0AAN5X9B0_CROSK|nr:C-type lysozyme inhibitor [Cronobacter sakazakii]EGT4274543.1 C-type lysozyme inhibitor [Cronobacter sakazakii]EGT5694623.1 C-type lysozyme inhibitor [Cronobacter sakazakii]EGT5701420.1 C-type lysozyme inhibitor [Cronobacter sakazakii]EGT5718177.1 C-type lysozyme inhibitor [Cronobacter sakazakii]EGT5724155.1 C-type lysozyme inhibitor [Cronobacter sakazakii]
MKKLLVVLLPTLLAGCSYYDAMVERMNTDTLEYRCDEKPLTVSLNKQREQVSFVLDDKMLHLSQGRAASGTRYTDGIYAFWSEGDEATVYHRDNIVLNHCKLQNPKR